MSHDGYFRRRHLPHWDVEGKPIFITACLEGSISAAGLQSIERYRLELEERPRPEQMLPADWKHHKLKLVFAFIDDLLDNQSAAKHLADERQAQIVQDAFLHFAATRYALLAFVVMPSHHHWLFWPDEKWAIAAAEESRKAGSPRTPREIISHSVQSYTATMCNRVRSTTGPYWQTETFDHWARDEAEMFRIMDYIERNPVKAGLVERPEDWKWSSARLRAQSGQQPGTPISKIER